MKVRVDFWKAVTAVIFALFAIFLVAPLLSLFVSAFKDADTGGWTIANFATFFTRKYYYRTLFRSLAVSSCVTLAAVALGNVSFANKCYLKLKLQYENAYAFYSVLTARVLSTEGFDENTRLALIGSQDNLLHSFPELDTEEFPAIGRDLINAYSRENLLRYYLGFELPFASGEETERLAQDPRVLAMAEYPYDGSVRKIDDFIVVRLG